jgi:hypothetical protein
MHFFLQQRFEERIGFHAREGKILRQGMV